MSWLRAVCLWQQCFQACCKYAMQLHSLLCCTKMGAAPAAALAIALHAGPSPLFGLSPLPPPRYFDTNYHFEVPELSNDSGERCMRGCAAASGACVGACTLFRLGSVPSEHGQCRVATHTHLPCPLLFNRSCPAPTTSRLAPTLTLLALPWLTLPILAAPAANWAPLLDRVRRGQATVGRDHAVPIVVGECSSADIHCTASLGALAALPAYTRCAGKLVFPVTWPFHAPRLTCIAQLCCSSNPLLAGPNTLLGLARGTFDRSALLARLVPAYVQLLRELAALGVPEVQVSGSQMGWVANRHSRQQGSSCHTMGAIPPLVLSWYVSIMDCGRGAWRSVRGAPLG